MASGLTKLMILKDKTVTPNIKPELVLGLIEMERQYKQVGAEMIITSLNDGGHMQLSLHYAGLAADIRTHNLNSSQKEQIVDIFNANMPGYYAFVEYLGQPNEHIHLEYRHTFA